MVWPTAFLCISVLDTPDLHVVSACTSFPATNKLHVAGSLIVWQRFCEPSPDLGFQTVRSCVCVCVCVCLSVLTGIELWIHWTDFNATLHAGYCYGLVVIP